ncbi:DUF523 domain-containing protein [Thalassospira sp. MCCC 1A01428]|uniref:DUF523 domain-containing protein n=1 Tax=Thalassospira sp. MCCC 1A01428 TaxID=1470575 RepID=UPI000A1F915A|nr:DUF523 domain-containing protein [Thalassospira sp. MCCC 1A01428]OSQ44263.1 purine nucleoside phosphorylase [Thalassospira sp. MCCC 1A01428]
MPARILISSCLLGAPVRYNGSAKTLVHDAIELWQEQGRLVPVCPEISAGLPIPRPPAEIEQGYDGTDVLVRNARVVENTGRDVTDAFLSGAQIALDLARSRQCRFALLTDGSPSCGSSFIYNGQFNGTRHNGVGATVALLQRNGIAVFANTEQGIALLQQALNQADRAV